MRSCSRQTSSPRWATECYHLIGQELADKSGVSGTALKLAYKTVKTFMPGHVEFMVRDLLPDMVDQLDPFWAGFRTSGGAEFGDYLTKRGDEVAEALLTVTDAQRGRVRTANGHQGVQERARQRRSSTSRPRCPGSARWCRSTPGYRQNRRLT